jgi:hypothetical protein
VYNSHILSQCRCLRVLGKRCWVIGMGLQSLPRVYAPLCAERLQSQVCLTIFKLHTLHIVGNEDIVINA